MSTEWGPRQAGQIRPDEQGPNAPAPATDRSNLFFGLALISTLGFILLIVGLATVSSNASAAPLLILLGIITAAAPVFVLLGKDRTKARGHRALPHVRSALGLKPRTTPITLHLPSGSAKETPIAPPPVLALEKYQKFTRSMYGCAFLGLNAETGAWSVANRRHAILVIGPPQSGKTSSIIIPSVLSASGPVVATSTKTDVLRATAFARSQIGRIWIFDPLGTEAVPEGVKELHWSPIKRCLRWDSAREMSDAMVGASSVSEGVQDGSYWAESAKTLIAPLLHAAALSGRSILDVRRAISRMEVDDFLETLRGQDAPAAADDLLGISERTEGREQSSIFSSARMVLAAYGSDEVAKRSVTTNFDSDEFVHSCDTVYVTAPAQSQNLVAPLVAGLLDEIRDAAYRLAREPSYSDRRNHPVFWALDEVANIAPIKKLPSIVSEAGGQGLQILACLQDLSQARVRWGQAADGFLSLFAIKAVLPGIGDKTTLEALSTMAGDWDRPYKTTSNTRGKNTSLGFPSGVSVGANSSSTLSQTTRREAQITPSEISNIPRGYILALQSGRWSLLRAVPFYVQGPWKEVQDEAPSTIVSHNTEALPDTGATPLTRPDHLPDSDGLQRSVDYQLGGSSVDFKLPMTEKGTNDDGAW